MTDIPERLRADLRSACWRCLSRCSPLFRRHMHGIFIIHSAIPRMCVWQPAREPISRSAAVFPGSMVRLRCWTVFRGSSGRCRRTGSRGDSRRHPVSWHRAPANTIWWRISSRAAMPANITIPVCFCGPMVRIRIFMCRISDMRTGTRRSRSPRRSEWDWWCMSRERTAR